MQIKGKKVIVTGASSGIGRATALSLARWGADVALVARRGELLEQVAEEARSAGVRALVFPCDVSNPDAVEATFRRIQEELGGPDILVNAAGSGVWKPFSEITTSEHRAMMDVNYWGAFHWIRAVLPGMRERRRGRIVNVSSASGKFALAVTSGYSASKYAVTGLSEALHRELPATGVGVSCLHPGSVRTAFFSPEAIRTADLPPIVRYSPKMSPQAVARSVRYCIWFGFPVWTAPVFVNFLVKANALWVRLGDLILWRWFFPLFGGLLLARILFRLLRTMA
jgi:NAD(P)-dependent dehydrogenase (short-subunit alcohol dehydrogenase family)